MLKRIFLAALAPESIASTPELAALFAAIAAFFLFFLIIGIAVYLYTAFAWMSISKKTKTEPAWLAFIPIANAYLLSKIAKKHWWPILLIPVMFVPSIGFVAAILFVVFMFIWKWHAFERVRRPGWWPLLAIVPIVGWIAYLILLGISAWGKK